jgi:uncharacterized membrane protein YeaQ/YmgE (transglycosylase-associated protein family)
MVLSQVIAWLVVGALAGHLTGIVVKRKKKGFGRLANLGIGLIGALIGGAIFNLFGIDFGLGEVAISLKDIIAAFIGSIIFLLGVWLFRRQKKDRPKL